MIEPERIRVLSDEPPARGGRYVLYWMQQSQRARVNPALEYAVQEANRLGLPLLAVFGLTDGYPEANARHYTFMLEGLGETARALARRGIAFVVRRGEPPQVVLALAPRAALIVCDGAYLRHPRAWRASVVRHARRRVVEVEGDVVVPLRTASVRLEFAARTLRPRLNRQRDRFLVPLAPTRLRHRLAAPPVPSELDPERPAALLDALAVDRRVGAVTRFRGGTTQARRHLRRFIREGLTGYADARSDPSAPRCSNLSPYLHFGQISPVDVALEVIGCNRGSATDREAFLEELIVRRELAINFVAYEPRYDRYEALPRWAQQTLSEHAGDDRAPAYTARALEAAATADPYWNAAMKEMLRTGYMHNYMRMYWGKKILEWSPTPQAAFRTLLRLNNRYFLDGRDPNSYAGVAWIFGLHDRPWQERPIFGKVRYMNARGLERKFDIAAYVAWVEGLES